MATSSGAVCPWAKTPLLREYHDAEWGVPLHDDRALFELLILEGAQAGLSWSVVLAKRDRYRQAYRGFDPAKVARFGARDQARLMADAGLVRNRLKIAASVANANVVLALQAEFGSFDRYLWSFVGGKPIDDRRRGTNGIPVRSAQSDALSADLRRRGAKFVGTTILYAFMQASGMVNDHLVSCPRHAACARLA